MTVPRIESAAVATRRWSESVSGQLFESLEEQIRDDFDCALGSISFVRGDRLHGGFGPEHLHDLADAHFDDVAAATDGLLLDEPSADGDDGAAFHLLIPLRTAIGVGGIVVVSGNPSHLESHRRALAAAVAAQAADIDAAIRFEEETGRAERAEALLGIADALTDAIQPRHVLPEIARRAAVAAGFARATVFLIDDDDILVAEASSWADGRDDLRLLAVFADLGRPPPTVARVAETGKPALYKTPREVPGLDPDRWLVPAGSQTVVVAPLAAWGRSLGALVLDDPRPDAIEREDLEFIREVAARVSTAGGLCRDLDREKALRERSQVVLGTVVQAATQANTAGVLSVIADGANQVLGDDTTMTFMTDGPRPGRLAISGDGTGAFDLIGALGDPERFTGSVAPLDSQRGGVRALYGESLRGCTTAVDRKIGRLLVVPLRRVARDIGWLVSYDYREEPYQESELRVVSALAAQASLSLHTALLLETERAAVTRLEELDQLKTGFVAAVSHELRTPLTAIVGFSEILAERIHDGEDQDFVEDIRRESSVLESLIANLLDSSRLEAGMLELNLEPVDVGVVINEAVSVVQHGYRDRTIEIHPVPEIGLILADGSRLRQVLLNLVENAVKYSPPDTIVETLVVAHRDFVEFAVDDRGPGIPEGQRDLIFERFHRLVGRELPGSGIGLYLVRALVEAHGGTISVSDRSDGAGSRFTVRIPRVAPPAD